MHIGEAAIRAQRSDARPMSGATPLAAIAFVAIDTETTGLDPSSARIVEIAVTSDPDSEPLLVTRVAPDVPIPTSSTRIHGITDEMVGAAPPFATILPDMARLLSATLVVGHAVGFDLAVLDKEAQRAGLAWQKPRALCVRTLAMVAAPMLANHSLDGIAHWLGIEISGRHSARGDAEAAARIFRALLPRLAQRGIVTLAEAESASRRQGMGSAADAGWIDPVGAAAPVLTSLSDSDIFAYRHTVGELARPPEIIAASAPLEAAMRRMVEGNISSVLVADEPAPDQPVAAYGILTERDILRRLTKDGPSVLLQPSGPMASRPLQCIRSGAFVYRAIGRLQRLGIRHLAVRTESGRLQGVVSARDLLRTLGGEATSLNDAIVMARSAEDLRIAWAGLPAVVTTLIGEGLDATLVARIVSEELRAMTRQAAILSEAAMLADGLGPPPARYALLVLGSGGRGESLLAPDQDHAIVFDAAIEGSGIDGWLAELGRRISETLDRSGIPLCKGGVMASNPKWRGSFTGWEERIAGWIEHSRPEDLLNVDIFFDMMPVHGDIDLGQALLHRVYEMGANQPAFAKLLADRITAGHSLTLLGNIHVDGDGRIDLKAHGLFPIVAFARALALKSGLALRPTAERLGAIAHTTGRVTDINALVHDHGVIMRTLLLQQARDIEAGIPPSNRIDPTQIDGSRRARLRLALRRVRHIPEMIRELMFD